MSGERFSDLRKRCVTAAALIGALLVLEFIYRTDPKYALLFPAVAFGVVVLCAAEFSRLCLANVPFRTAAALFACVLPAVLVLTRSAAYPIKILETTAPHVLAAGVIGAAVALFFQGMAGRSSLEDAKGLGLEVLLGSVLLGFGGGALVNLSQLQTHALLYWIVIVVAANDSGAYFTGLSYGRHKLSHAISPGKSIEGTVGGLLCGALAGLLFAYLAGYHSVLYTLGLSLTVGLFAQLFDLGKSVMKRLAGVKNSGSLLPGHGGVLDRMDGILGGALAVHMFSAFF